MNEYIVNELDAGKRLDRKLSELSEEFSRTQWQKVISNGTVLVNDVVAKANLKLKEGDRINYEEPEVEEMDVTPVKMDLEIIYEDDDLMVINKPKGLVVHPGAGTTEPTLVSGLLYHCQSLSTINGPTRPGIVHRIDKNTSGLLVVAKNDVAHHELAKQLEDRTLSRKYIALVEGVIQEENGTIDAPIGRDPKDRTKMIVRPENSKNAVTEFQVLERFRNHTLIECKLQTGRTHQIRVHMKFIRHPIVGDPQYGIKSEYADTQMLHAYAITFVHPTTKEEMSFEIPYPTEFEEVLSLLRKREGRE